MAMPILLKFQTLKCDISRTIWRIEVSDGSLFCIFHALSFERNVFFDWPCPLSLVSIKPLPTTTNFELKQSDSVGRMTAQAHNRFVFCVVVAEFAVNGNQA